MGLDVRGNNLRSIYKHPLSVLQREQAPFEKNLDGKASEQRVPLQALSD